MNRPGFCGGRVLPDLARFAGSTLMLGEEFVNGDRFVAAGAEAADAEQGAGLGAVVAPLVAEVALFAVGADVDAELAPAVAGHGWSACLQRGAAVSGPPGGLSAGRAAEPLSTHR